MEYRVVSPRSKTTISRMISLTSTNSRSGVPFLKICRTRLMISAARVTSLMVLNAASRASSRSGASRVSHRMHVLASVTAAAIGWFTSCAREAVSSPIVVTRLTRARSELA